jgi:hypothetical protein
VGSGRSRIRRTDLPAGGLALLVASVPVVALWGFTVDDAFIPARYAHNLARGLGYTFNAGQASSDGVTPLGFAHLLTPFARGGVFDAFSAARWLGVALWLAAAALLGVAMQRSSEAAWSGRAAAGARRFTGLALVLASAPLGAWAGAGLETGLVTALVASGAALHTLSAPRAAAVLVGLAAGLRPELLPFAMVAALAPVGDAASLDTSHLGAAAVRMGLALAPFAAVAALRLWFFGRPMPLSALAKAPDALHGLYYAVACALLAGPIALAAPLAFAGMGRARSEEHGAPMPRPRALRHGRWWAFAVFVHLAAVALAGGDWMPLSRLIAPVLPVVALAASQLAVGLEGRARVVHFARVGLAVAAQLWVSGTVGPRAREVLAERLEVARQLSPALRGASTVAALDVGWLGMSLPDAVLVDLAGVTDPVVAAMPGGHTQKRIPDTFLDERRVDALVLLVARDVELGEPWTKTRFDRGVERWVALAPTMDERFELRATSSGRLRYAVVLRRVERLASASP